MIEKLQMAVLFFPVFLFSLSFHEAAHAYVADKFGDDTARQMGRVTLNPLPHMDPIGTFFLPLLLLLTSIGLPIGGWGKPVPVNPYNLKDPRKDGLWIAAAGPISNLILTLIFTAFVWLMYFGIGVIDPVFLQNNETVTGVIRFFFQMGNIGIWINLALAFFNMIPFHPLDGGKVLEGLLPDQWVEQYNQIAKYGMLILFGLYYLGAYKIIFYPVQYLSRLLSPI